jgi:hypothetical protein
MSAVPLSIAQVAEVTARAYGVTVLDLKSTRRPEHLATARNVAMTLAYRLTRNSSPAIGRWFGSRDHSTVLSAIKRTANRMKDDPEFAADVHAVAMSAAAVANSAYERTIGAVDAVAIARRLARASDRDLMHVSTQEIAALALRVVEAQHVLLDAAHLVRGLASPRLIRNEPALARRAAQLAAGLEALGVIEITTQKEAA